MQTQLTKDQLTYPRESLYFKVVLLFALLGWLLLLVSIFGIVYAIFFGVMVWFAQGRMSAYIRAESVEITNKQWPQLRKLIDESAEKVGISPAPHAYILESPLLNAFASRFWGRNFIVLNSAAVEAYGLDSDEIRFLVGHELGHIKSNHLFKFFGLLVPAAIVPLLMEAYKRNAEQSCVATAPTFAEMPKLPRTLC